MTIRDIPPLGDGWWPCPCCDGSGGSNSGPLPDHAALVAAARGAANLIHLAYESPDTLVEAIDRAEAALRAALDGDENRVAPGQSTPVAPGSAATASPLDVDRLRWAIYNVSLRHDWANTVDTEDRTEEIAAEYAALLGDEP